MYVKEKCSGQLVNRKKRIYEVYVVAVHEHCKEKQQTNTKGRKIHYVFFSHTLRTVINVLSPKFVITIFWAAPAPEFFSPEIASLLFQTSQQKGQKIHASCRTIRWEIHPKGPDRRASPRRKLKSHSFLMVKMRSKIDAYQPETVPLIASFWLDVINQMVKQ